MPRHPPHRKDWKPEAGCTSFHSAQLLTLLSSGDKAGGASPSSAPVPEVPESSCEADSVDFQKVVLATLFGSHQHVLH